MKSYHNSITKINEESGFILMWASFLLMGIFFAGVTFLLYAASNVARMKAQYLAMNLVTAGAYSAEFDSKEALNNMAMLAHFEGFRWSQPTKLGQQYSKGSLLFGHEVKQGSQFGVSALVTLDQENILGGLFSNLIGVSTSSFSKGMASPLYLKLTYDYSSSIANGSIDSLLKGFNVMNAAGGVGPNGQLVGGAVVPKAEIQTALPFAWDPTFRIVKPWDSYSSTWPTILKNPAPACSNQSEVGCNIYASFISSQKEELLRKASDLFLEYKKGNTTLAGSVGRVTPHLDIDILCGMLPTGFITAVNNSLDISVFDPVQNNGVCDLWKYDETVFSNYTLNGSGEIRASIVKEYSAKEPKDIFFQDASMAPNRILQHYLDLTFSRKLLRYGNVQSLDGLTDYSTPTQFSSLLDPNRPILKERVFPNDAFAFNTGPIKDTASYKRVINDPLLPFGWPGRVVPLLSATGNAYPLNAELPQEIRYPKEFNCTTGPPKSMNFPMSADVNDPGNVLCHIYNQCNPTATQIDCFDQSKIDSSEHKNDYFYSSNWTDKKKSPSCASGGKPTCFEDVNLTIKDTDNSVQCINGTPRCFGDNPWAFPGCADGSTLSCCEWEWDGVSSYTCKAYNLSASPVVPDGHLEDPLPRGLVTFPSTAATTVGTDIIHYLNDLSAFPGGTHTHNAVPLDRCRDLKTALVGQNVSCAWVLVTDGKPNPVDAEGNQVISQAQALADLSSRMDEFTNTEGAKTFTWFLGSAQSSYDELLSLLLASTLDPAITKINDDYISQELSIPGSSCSDWNTSRPVGAPDCNTYNTQTLPNHLDGAANFTQFQSVMSSGNNRFFITSDIQNTVNGTELSQEFLDGLTHLLSLLKREISFQK